jgi:putative transposase
VGSHAAQRLRSFDYRGFRSYSITCCTFARRPWFTDSTIVDRARAALLQQAIDASFDISAYCFMPDHVHLLLDATATGSDLVRFMHGWKQRTGYRHAREKGHRLWQQGYYDHILRHDAARWRLIAYIIDNPVRAGLAAAPIDYPFWGSGIWTRDQILECCRLP